MKGLLAGTIFNKPSTLFLGKYLSLKRKKVHASVRKTKRRKTPCPVEQQIPCLPLEVASSCPVVEFQDNRAVVRLVRQQMVAFDGCATVCLVEGSASMLGYSLARAIEVVIYSNSDHCSALTFETDGACKLQFRSYDLDHPDDDVPTTFRLEWFHSNEGVPKQEEGARKSKVNSENMRRIRPTIVPADWSLAADSILSFAHKSPPVVPVCGAKNAGKSTFARFLVNKLLRSYKAVGYLDTDVGQPEFTIPGCLSFHIVEEPITGSPVSHLRVPQRCFFYGDITPKSDPAMYLEYFKKLYDHFRQKLLEIPLVINSSGWRTGVGYDLLVEILRYSSPTHVVELNSGETGKLPSLSAGGTALVLHVKGVALCTDSEDECMATAPQLRALRVLSYFQECIGRHSFQELEFSQVAEALACQVPYQVIVDDLQIRHLHMEVPSSQSLYSLNAQLVGLGVCSSVDDDKQACVGFGIIRGVNVVKRILHVLTPCSTETLKEVDTILHGRVEIPVDLLQVEGYVCPYMCRTHVVEGTGLYILRRRMRKRKR